MRKLIASMLLAAAAVGATPAAAQAFDPGHRGYGYNDGRHRGGDVRFELRRLIDRIHRAEDRDHISKREEARLLSEARRIDRRYDRYRHNGLTRWERQDLQGRIHALQRQLRYERFDDNDRRWGR